MHASTARACGSERNTVSFNSSSRNRPLKLSTKAFWVRLAGRDVVPSDAALVGPPKDRVRRELGPVVADNRSAAGRALQRGPVEFARDPRPRERRISAMSARHSRVKSSTTARMRNRRPTGQLIGHEVERPPLAMALAASDDRCPKAQSALAAAAFANGKAAQPAIEPEHPLVVHHMAFAPQQAHAAV